MPSAALTLPTEVPARSPGTLSGETPFSTEVPTSPESAVSPVSKASPDARGPGDPAGSPAAAAEPSTPPATAPGAVQAPALSQDSLIEYRGRLPRAVFELIRRMQDHELRKLRLVPGRFEENGSLAAGARLLHLYLSEMSRAAAAGRIPFVKAFRIRTEIKADIARLCGKIQRAAEDAALILPQDLQVQATKGNA